MQAQKITFQTIHCKAIQIHSKIRFYITFVYGFNHDHQRLRLWEDLEQTVVNMTDPWHVIGDFNVILTPEDTIGGNEISDHEVRDFADCIELCGL